MEKNIEKAKYLEMGRRYLVTKRVWGNHVNSEVLDSAKYNILSGNPGLAKELLDSQNSLSEDPEALNTRALANIYLGNHSDSERDYERAYNLLRRQESIVLSGCSGNWIEWSERADDDEMLDKAIECAKKAISIDPTWHFAYVNLGVAYIKKGELDKAVSVLEQDLKNFWPEGIHNKELIEAVLGNDAYWSAVNSNPEYRKRIRFALNLN